MNKLLIALFVFVAWAVVAALADVPVMLPLQLVAHVANVVFQSLNLPIRLP
jgi:hypothetical protein